jgi:hypothetical protein
MPILFQCVLPQLIQKYMFLSASNIITFSLITPNKVHIIISYKKKFFILGNHWLCIIRLAEAVRDDVVGLEFTINSI